MRLKKPSFDAQALKRHLTAAEENSGLRITEFKFSDTDQPLRLFIDGSPVCREDHEDFVSNLEITAALQFLYFSEVHTMSAAGTSDLTRWVPI